MTWQPATRGAAAHDHVKLGSKLLSLRSFVQAQALRWSPPLLERVQFRGNLVGLSYLRSLGQGQGQGLSRKACHVAGLEPTLSLSCRAGGILPHSCHSANASSDM